MNATHRSREKRTAHPVDVMEDEIEMFKALNKNEEYIMLRAERLRNECAEFQDLPAVEALVLKTKVDHLEYIRDKLATGTTVANAIGQFVADKNSGIFTIVNAARDHNPFISLRLSEWFQPDFELRDDREKQRKKKVITSDMKGPKISTVLKRFGISDIFASGAEKVYEKGMDIDADTLGSIAVNIFARYFASANEDTDTSNFDYSRSS